VDAQRALAEVLERRGKYVRAFDEYEYLVSNYAGRFPFGEIVERQFRIANLVMSARHGKFLFVPGFTSPEKAIPLFEKLVAGAPAAGQSAEALFRLAQLHQQARDYAQAAAAFERFQYSHPAGPFREEADLGRAECLYQMARLSPRDETACRDALSCLSVFLRDHPQSPAAGAVRERLDALKRRLADMYYDRALFYDRRHRRKPQAALIAYRDFVANFPGSDRAERARGRIAALERRAEVRDEK
jgi:outer membrane assembly lipoprotein YfiO